MKKIGILHAQLSRIIASMGHGDMLVVADAGLPVPPGVETVDLALVAGVPGFLETVEAVLRELQVQEAIIGAEMAQVSPGMYGRFMALWPKDVPVRAVPHVEFKEITRQARAVVRTGEFTPYSNVILVAGVLF
ncbi:MAG TPA: D-ribose pyranase [Limnochordales bacterium]